MGSHTRIYDRFAGYSIADCDCVYCLYWQGSKLGCSQKVCCCLEEKEIARRRENEAESASVLPELAVAV